MTKFVESQSRACTATTISFHSPASRPIRYLLPLSLHCLDCFCAFALSISWIQAFSLTHWQLPLTFQRPYLPSYVRSTESYIEVCARHMAYAKGLCRYISNLLVDCSCKAPSMSCRDSRWGHGGSKYLIFHHQHIAMTFLLLHFISKSTNIWTTDLKLVRISRCFGLIQTAPYAMCSFQQKPADVHTSLSVPPNFSMYAAPAC
jgi:hypothetical protein